MVKHVVRSCTSEKGESYVVFAAVEDDNTVAVLTPAHNMVLCHTSGPQAGMVIYLWVDTNLRPDQRVEYNCVEHVGGNSVYKFLGETGKLQPRPQPNYVRVSRDGLTVERMYWLNNAALDTSRVEANYVCHYAKNGSVVSRWLDVDPQLYATRFDSGPNEVCVDRAGVSESLWYEGGELVENKKLAAGASPNYVACNLRGDTARAQLGAPSCGRMCDVEFRARGANSWRARISNSGVRPEVRGNLARLQRRSS
jgi:hypothetical protein